MGWNYLSIPKFKGSQISHKLNKKKHKRNLFSVNHIKKWIRKGNKCIIIIVLVIVAYFMKKYALTNFHIIVHKCFERASLHITLLNTPVTQDGDLAATRKISQIAAGSLWDLIERRGSAADRSKVSNVAEVTAKFWTCSKQAQRGCRRNRSP